MRKPLVAFLSFLCAMIATGGTSVDAGSTSASMSLVTYDAAGLPADCNYSSCNVDVSLSGDGRYVVFQSAADALSGDACGASSREIYLRDIQAGETACLGEVDYGQISANGQAVLLIAQFPFTDAHDQVHESGLYLYDVDTGSYELQNLSSQGDQLPAGCCALSISGNAEWIAFGTFRIYARNIETGTTEEIPTMNGEQPDQDALGVGVSDDGRYVAFSSAASNYTSDATGGYHQVFLRDRVSGETTVITRSVTGGAPDGGSYQPQVSGDGRYVLFASDAGNLVEGDVNNRRDAFIYDLQKERLELVSVASGGSPLVEGIFNSSRMSPDGRFVAFISHDRQIDPLASNGYANAFVHDRETGRTALASRALFDQPTNEDSYYVGVSSSGDKVTFTSSASNLISGVHGQHVYLSGFPDSDGDGHWDPFDLCPDDSNPGNQPDFDSDGVADDCDNCPETPNPDQADSDGTGPGDACAGDNDGDGLNDGEDNCPDTPNPGQANGDGDEYGDVCDNCPDVANGDQADANFDGIGDACTQSNEIERVSVSGDGTQADGRSVAGQVSADGRYVAFTSNASNLVAEPASESCVENIGFWEMPTCYAIYLRDRQAGTTQRLPLQGNGLPLDANSMLIDMTPDARFFAFWSTAASLGVPQSPIGGTIPGVFVFDRETGATDRVDIAANGSPSTDYTSSVSLSDDGRLLTLTTRGALVASDTNHNEDIYVRDRETQTTTRATVSLSGGESTFGTSGGAISGDGSTIAFGGVEADFVSDLPESYIENVIIQTRAGGVNSVLPLAESDPRISEVSAAFLSEDGKVVTLIAVVWYGTGANRQVIQYDRVTETYTVASVNTLGQPAAVPGSSHDPDGITTSRNGSVVVFTSNATNLVQSDANNCRDVFVRQTETGLTSRANVSASQAEADHAAQQPQVSASGNAVIFESIARTLVPGDTNGQTDVFLISVSDTASAGWYQPTGTPSAPLYCGPPPGDFDCDDEVTPADALLLLRWLAKLKPFGECQLLANPMSCFEELSPKHSLIILRFAAGLIDAVGGCGGK